MENAEFVVKDLPVGRILQLIDSPNRTVLRNAGRLATQVLIFLVQRYNMMYKAWMLQSMFLFVPASKYSLVYLPTTAFGVCHFQVSALCFIMC